MQEQSTPRSRRSRRSRLIGGALVGAVLSIGVVGGTASAGRPVPSKPTTTVVEDGRTTAVPSFARAFGIRW